MKKYILMFYGGDMRLRYDNLDKVEKEEKVKHGAAWSAWMAKLAKKKNQRYSSNK